MHGCVAIESLKDERLVTFLQCSSARIRACPAIGDLMSLFDFDRGHGEDEDRR